MKISFCVITLNEEENLGPCLESCADLADEILVLDSGSKDRTGEIAAEFQARWEHQDWLGFVGQKNEILRRATCEWVFSLDADEELSGPLREEIKTLKKMEPSPDIAGFSMPRCVCYEGKWIRHGDWYPDRLARLFRRERARFEGGKVHEGLELSGRVLPLTGDLNHYSFRDLADHRARAEKYAQLWAESQFEAGRRIGPFAPFTHAFHRWFKGYIARRGFLDGSLGWRIAAISASETFKKYRLLRKMNKPQSISK